MTKETATFDGALAKTFRSQVSIVAAEIFSANPAAADAVVNNMGFGAGSLLDIAHDGASGTKNALMIVRAMDPNNPYVGCEL